MGNKNLGKNKLYQLNRDIEEIVYANLTILCARLSHKDYCKVLLNLRDLIDEYVEGNCDPKFYR